jgi:hypothetical protein
MNDNLLQLNRLRKSWKKRTVELNYQVLKKVGVSLELELVEAVVNTGFAIYEWMVAYNINDVTEYAASGSSAKASDIYEEVLMFFTFIRVMERVPVDTWELVRMDINEFLASGNLATLN